MTPSGQRHSTEKLVWELAAFLGKRDWLVGPALPPPAVAMVYRPVLASAFSLVFIDGTARGSGDVDGLLAHWVDAIPEALRSWVGHADPLSHFVVLCFCDLPEPLATQVLFRKRQKIFAARHALCHSIDFAECTVRGHRGFPLGSSYGLEEIREFLAQWREFRE